MTHTLICGDAFAEVAKLAPDSVDAMVTHPPYFLLTHGIINDAFGGLSDNAADYQRKLLDLFNVAIPALKPGGMIAYVLGDTPRARAIGHIGMAWRVALGAHDEGWHLIESMPWAHGDSVSCAIILARKRVQLHHELPISWDEPIEFAEGYTFGVWPERLVDLLIRGTCPVGGTVLDPFCGTGMTGYAADIIGRNSIQIDKDPDAIRIAHGRMGVTAWSA